MKYVLHATVEKYDFGLEAPTTARPTCVVDAKSKEDAKAIAENDIRETNAMQGVKIKSITFEKVEKKEEF